MRKVKKINMIVKAFYNIFGTLPLLITLYIYPLIPSKIPIHYWMNGTIDRWGSKNELFIVPIIIFLLFVVFKPKFFYLSFNYEPEDKITRWNNYYFLIILNILVYTNIYISLNYETCLDNFNFYNFFACSICFLFGFYGNYIPNCSRISSFSIRNKYTLESHIIWHKTHRFCGILWFTGSIMFFPMLLFSSNYYLLPIAILMLCIFLISPIIYMKYLHEKYIKGELKDNTRRKKIHHSH